MRRAPHAAAEPTRRNHCSPHLACSPVPSARSSHSHLASTPYSALACLRALPPSHHPLPSSLYICASVLCISRASAFSRFLSRFPLEPALSDHLLVPSSVRIVAERELSGASPRWIARQALSQPTAAALCSPPKATRVHDACACPLICIPSSSTQKSHELIRQRVV